MVERNIVDKRVVDEGLSAKYRTSQTQGTAIRTPTCICISPAQVKLTR